jgi:outer membrane protein insertion porin family
MRLGVGTSAFPILITTVLGTLWIALAGFRPCLAADKADSDRTGVYELHFHGNSALSEKRLREAATDELRDFERSGQKRADADDAAFEMELAYRRAGHSFATVDYRYERIKGKTVVTFVVAEGPRVLIKRIRITGNQAFPTEDLLSLFAHKKNGLLGIGRPVFVEGEVRDAVSEIRELYRGNGYLDVKIDGPEFVFSRDRARVDVVVAINEGGRFLIRRVDFEGDVPQEAVSPLEELAGQMKDIPYFRRKKLLLRSRILEVYGELGYADADADVLESQGDSPGNVVLTALISSGPKVRITKIVISGAKRTRASFIRSRLKLRPGDPYDVKKKRASFRELYRTGLFKKVDLRLKRTAVPGEQTLEVSVEEAPVREFFLEPGWGSYELLRLRAGFEDKNVRGTGRVFLTQAGASFKGENGLIQLTDPWFLGSSVVCNVPVSYRRREEPAFTRRETEASIFFSRDFTEALSMSLAYLYRRTRISEADELTAEEIGETNYGVASIRAQATLDTRDDLFFPTSGYRLHASAEFSDPAMGSDIGFVRLTGGVRLFSPLPGSAVLGFRYNTGLILPVRNQESIPLGERFYNGGENTVRSFRESRLGPLDLDSEPVGGLAFNVLSLELRRKLWGRFAGSIFFDWGNVSPNRSRAEQGKPPYDSRSELVDTTFSEYFRDFRAAVGFGVQYLLPVGPARLDIAFNPSPREERNESAVQVHFSLGAAF